MDRLAPTRRPRARAQGFQRWHRLLFSHWVVPESVLRPLVPARLSLDTFEGRCFVGVVAFTMQHVKPWLWAPVIPGGAFGEINLRTYAQIGAAEPPSDPDSLEFFLSERYQFYAEIGGRLRRARVHHEPYLLHDVQRAEVDDGLLRAAGLPTDGVRTRDLFSPGVDVDIYPLEDV